MTAKMPDRKNFSSVQSSQARRPALVFNSVQAIRSAASAPDPAAVPHLIRALGHRNEQLRLAAASAIPAYGEAGFYGLLRAAAHGNRRQRQEAVNCLGRSHDVRALQPLLAALENDRRERTKRTVLLGICAVMVTSFFGLFAGPMWAVTFNAERELQVCAAQALGNLGDVRAILPLIRLAQEKNPAVRMSAHNALLRLLPLAAELKPDQARLLGANAVAALSNLLSCRDERLIRETMAVLYAIGDRQAIPAVQRLTADPYLEYLSQEAERLLSVLRERAAQEELRTTLLRGSREARGTSGGHLLRPAAGASDAPLLAEGLLRPVGEAASSGDHPGAGDHV